MGASQWMEALWSAGLRLPKTLTVAITGACNLSCSHCWVEAGERSSAGHVPVATLKRVIAEFAAIGGEGIRVTGGEPLCHPDCLGLLRFASSCGFQSVILQTNAMLLDEGAVDLLAELDFPGLTIQVSLDGSKAATHDKVRGDGAYAGLMLALRRLERKGLARRVAVFFTEMHHNLEEVPALFELAEEFGLGSVATGALVSCGRADKGSLAPPHPSQYLTLLERFRSDDHFQRRYQRHGKVAALEWSRGCSPRGESCTFVENPYLTAEGRLYPCLLCHAEPYSVTGVFDKKLSEAFSEGASLWSGLLAASSRRPQEITQCLDCSERNSCGAGCLGRAWGSSGRVTAADDRCAVRRSIARQR